MQISFKALEKALAPIEKIGQGEITFDVDGIPVTLKLLVPDEELEVQKYCNLALDEEGATVPIEYVDRMKLSLLAYSVVQVGDQDLRDVDFIETEEKLDNGKVIKEPRHLAMRKLIKRWTSAVRTGLFRHYSDLVVQVEQKAEAAFKYTPMDLKVEIERLEKRINHLKKDLEQQTKDMKSPFGEMVKTVAESDLDEQKERETDMASYLTGQEPVVEAPVAAVQQAQPQQPAPRRSIIPQAPVTAPPPVQVVPNPQPVPAEAQPRPLAKSRAPLMAEDEPDSFADMEDPEQLQQAMNAETRRLLESRRNAASRPAPQVGGPTTRRPPHMDALETEALMQDPLRMATEEGMAGNRQIFRLPAQELSQSQPRKAPSDPVPDKTTRNPNFRKPQGV